MAKQVMERVLDDLDGSDGATPIEFGLDGLAYVIDLNTKHENELRAKLGPFLEAARRVRTERGRARRGAAVVSDKDRNSAIRAWAAGEGAEINQRGRIAQVVIEAYDAQDGDMLREALGVELVEAKPSRRGRRTADFSAR